MEQDPLLSGGARKIDIHESGLDEVYEPHSKTILHATMLGIAPWVLFVGVLGLMFRFWHHYTVLTLLVLVALLVVNAGFAVFEMAHGKKWLLWLGLLSTVALFAGVAVGGFNYYGTLLFYYAYGDLRKYTNVAGSEHAAGFADAAMIMFTKDTAVDTSQAVGLKDATTDGTVFCVAPVSDGSMTKDSTISFWAVGENCCEERSNFECDGAGQASARSGLVVLEVDKLVSEAVASVVAPMSKKEQYIKAIGLQNAVFGTSNAKENVFVRWTHDPIAMQDEFWNKTFAYCVTESVLYFVLSMLMGISAALQARPPPKHLY